MAVELYFRGSVVTCYFGLISACVGGVSTQDYDKLNWSEEIVEKDASPLTRNFESSFKRFRKLKIVPTGTSAYLFSSSKHHLRKERLGCAHLSKTSPVRHMKQGF